MTALPPIPASTRVDLSLRATSLALALEEAATFTDRLFQSDVVATYDPATHEQNIEWSYIDNPPPGRVLFDADPAELDWR